MLVKQSKQSNKLPTIPETQTQPNQNNHNYCFIESHNKVLDEQQTANDTIIKRQHERHTMINQIKKMIIIETIVEDNNNNNNNNTEYENEFMNVLNREQIQIKSEMKTKINSESTKINQSVPVTRTIVQGKEQIDEVKSNQYTNSSVPDSRTIVQDAIPTDGSDTTNEQSQIFKDKTGSNTEAHVHKVNENTVLGQRKTNTIDSPIQKNNETNHAQIFDTRLLINNKNNKTAEEFTKIIRDYNTCSNSQINEVGAYIINRVECRYTQAMRVVQRCRRWVKV